MLLLRLLYVCPFCTAPTHAVNQASDLSCTCNIRTLAGTIQDCTACAPLRKNRSRFSHKPAGGAGTFLLALVLSLVVLVLAALVVGHAAAVYTHSYLQQYTP